MEKKLHQTTQQGKCHRKESFWSMSKKQIIPAFIIILFMILFNSANRYFYNFKKELQNDLRKINFVQKIIVRDLLFLDDRITDREINNQKRTKGLRE